MSRPPSIETQLRNVTRERKQLHAELAETRAKLAGAMASISYLKQQLESWQLRFDQLLKIKAES